MTAFPYLEEAFKHPEGIDRSMHCVNKVKIYANANAVNMSFLAMCIDTGVNL